MMRCSKCGNKVKLDATFCTNCGNKLDNPKEVAENGVVHKIESLIFNTYKKYIIIGLVVICFIGYFFDIRCKSGFCLLPSGFRVEYCIAHTCRRDGCTNKKVADKNYCYTHTPTTTSGITYTPEVAEDVLKFSNIKITHNSAYTICTGTITNNGRDTYSFVEVKGKFKDLSGRVLDTDFTYAVGSEGLAPSESTTFRISVDKNRIITNCTIEILNYEKE